jgi:hypothetical protein
MCLRIIAYFPMHEAVVADNHFFVTFLLIKSFIKGEVFIFMCSHDNGLEG